MVASRSLPRRPFASLAAGLVAVAGCLVPAGGEEEKLVFARDGSGVYGYKDTPKLPWCDYLVHDPDRPAPPRVDPGPAGPPAPVPADAIRLFDGADVSAWTENDWRVVDGAWEWREGRSPTTRRSFGSFQLHVERSAAITCWFC